MSIFAMAQESADASESQAAATATPEDETATAEVSGTEEAAQAVAQESADLEQMGQEQEELGDVQEVIEQESGGLSSEAARYLKISLKRIVGNRVATKIIATENYSSGRSAQEAAKRFALESISDTLKSFWTAIKAQLKKFYAKVKTFFVKMFSGAKKLKARAEKLQNSANEMTGTMEEKSFSFSQTKVIAVDGKYNDAGAITTGLSNIQKWMRANLTVQKSDKYETIIERAQTAIEKSVKRVISEIKAGGDGLTGLGVDITSIEKELDAAGCLDIKPLASMSNPDQKLVDMYVGGKDSQDLCDISAGLPGGKSIVMVVAVGGTSNTIADISRAIKNSRLVLGNDKFTPRDVTEGDVKTLTTSQIDKVCDDVIDIAETAYVYEKAWDRRDKFQAKLEREIDQIIKDVDQEDDLDSKAQRAVRGYAEAFTASVRRRTTFESQFISYSLLTSNAFLNYAEKSLAQHKSK